MYHGRYSLHDQKQKDKTSSFRRMSASFKRKADSSGKGADSSESSTKGWAGFRGGTGTSTSEGVSNTGRIVDKAVDVVLGTTPIAPGHPIQRESEWQGPAGGKKNKKEPKIKGEKPFEAHWCILNPKALEFFDKETHGGKPKLVIKYKNIDRVEPWPSSAGIHTHTHTHTDTHTHTHTHTHTNTHTHTHEHTH